jgi:glycosyltransferase involved in cell wall biosynthesis
MHIVYNGWFWDQPNIGSGQYLRRLLHYLRRVDPDLDMTLVLPPHNTAPDDLPENVTLATTTGPGGKIGKIWFEQRTFPRVAARLQPDLVHVPYWGTPFSSPAPVITSILDVIPLVIPDYARGFATRLYTSLVSASARGSTHVLTLSEAAKTDIVDYLHIPAEHITPTYLAADDAYHPRLGSEHDESVREKYGLPERFVLYIGGFDLRKQVNQLLLAYTYVVQSEGDAIPLVLAGREPPWGTSVFPDMRRYAGQLDLADVIRWPGYIDEADKPALYRLADVFVFPTMAEGFGLPVIEAMSCGTPVVANAIDIMQEIVGDGAFLVDNAREMAGAIIALLNQKPLRDSMVNQGLAQATRFSWRKTAQQTLDVYRYIMGK